MSDLRSFSENKNKTKRSTFALYRVIICASIGFLLGYGTASLLSQDTDLVSSFMPSATSVDVPIVSAPFVGEEHSAGENNPYYRQEEIPVLVNEVVNAWYWLWNSKSTDPANGAASDAAMDLEVSKEMKNFASCCRSIFREFSEEEVNRVKKLMKKQKTKENALAEHISVFEKARRSEYQVKSYYYWRSPHSEPVDPFPDLLDTFSFFTKVRNVEGLDAALEDMDFVPENALKSIVSALEPFLNAIKPGHTLSDAQLDKIARLYIKERKTYESAFSTFRVQAKRYNESIIAYNTELKNLTVLFSAPVAPKFPPVPKTPSARRRLEALLDEVIRDSEPLQEKAVKQ